MEAFEYSGVRVSNTIDAQSTDYNEGLTKDENNRYHCTFPDCGKIFKFKSEATRHYVIHFNNRPFVCHFEDCRKSFKRADALDAHLQLHNKDLPFECNVSGCAKRFSTKACLKYHVLKHNDDRVFTCSFPGCGRTFFTKGQLKQHEKAFTYHINLAKMGVKEEALAFSSSGRSTDHTDFYGDFNTSSPSFVHNIDWELNSESVEENIVKIEEDDRESFESIVKYIVKDNAVIEKKKHFIEDDEPSFLMSNKEWSRPMVNESIFMDENELRILNFLKEQQLNHC